jgi:citrate lyase subunit beta / citryl-CoA lyase
MQYRSWMFVPGDSERKLAKAIGTGADVIIVDLDTSVTRDAKPAAREFASQWLRAHRRQIVESRQLGRWVRINSLDSGLWRDDLDAIMPSAPDGIMLPKADGPESVRLLAAEIYELEQRNGIPPGTTRILPIVAETARAAIAIAQYAETPHARLAGLTWNAEHLSAAIGATRHRTARGLTDLFRHVRSQTLLAAHACQIMPVETIHVDIADRKGLKVAAAEARADGFTGMLAVHPDQVPVINAAFTPGEDEIAEARAVIEAFSDSPGASALHVEGRIVAQPHLRLARRALGLSAEGGQALAAPRMPILRSA